MISLILLSSILTPILVWELFLNQFLQIDGLVELVGFGTWVADETFRIERFGNLTLVVSGAYSTLGGVGSGDTFMIV